MAQAVIKLTVIVLALIVFLALSPGFVTYALRRLNCGGFDRDGFLLLLSLVTSLMAHLRLGARP